jgi:hypothetical protein
MPRASVGFLFPLLLALALPAEKAPSAPVPKAPAKKDSLYFPTKVGAKWVYTEGDRDKTEVVTAVEHKPKEQVWVVSVEADSLKPKEKTTWEWEVSERGLRSLKFGFDPERDENSKWWLLKLPAKAGEKWEISGDVWFEALEPKRIKVSAGEFDAVGVDLNVGKIIKVTRWYAPGIGLVRIDDEKKPSCELKSFTPGKEE